MPWTKHLHIVLDSRQYQSIPQQEQRPLLSIYLKHPIINQIHHFISAGNLNLSKLHFEVTHQLLTNSILDWLLVVDHSLVSLSRLAFVISIVTVEFSRRIHILRESHQNELIQKQQPTYPNHNNYLQHRGILSISSGFILDGKRNEIPTRSTRPNEFHSQSNR